jgi:Uma2 family endonuclease
MTSTPTPPAPAQARPFDALAPLRLPLDLRLTPEQFERVCAENREAVLELDAQGHLITMTPAGSETSSRNSELLYQLQRYARSSGGWKVFESSAGFRLPDGSVLSPDASLLRLERWQALSPEQRRGFAPLCPDLVVELASPSDEGPRGGSALRNKMASYQANGARLGWLLLPHERAAEVWSAADQEASQEGPLRLEQAATLEGGAEFPGLCLNLGEIWAG